MAINYRGTHWITMQWSLDYYDCVYRDLLTCVTLLESFLSHYCNNLLGVIIPCWHAETRSSCLASVPLVR